ncbi:MAG: DUF502 domain-containing protein [Planctomycetota bacterium]
MRKFLDQFWTQGFLRTFLTGLVAVLPLAITFWIMNWVAGILRNAVGTDSLIGGTLRSVGMQFATNEYLAVATGWSIVLVGIWMVGVLVSGTARDRIQGFIDNVIKRIPLVNTVYGPVKQVVEMFAGREDSAVQGMKVVHCYLGDNEQAGFLCLLPSADTYRFQERDCHIVYLPSAPMPMTGFNLFVPVEQVTIVDMGVEDLMQVYFSLGVMTTASVPAGATKVAAEKAGVAPAPITKKSKP